jgi:threonine dehydrogenase-like Zn-dependent dehydrogenase
VRAITIEPGRPGSLRLEDMPDPGPADGTLLARTLAVGICGTDRELISGEYGEAPAGSGRLILGHESLAAVIEAPPDSGFVSGDLIVGIVRHPDPVPCLNCAAGEWDMCRNGLYTERGIKEAHGFAAERFRTRPGFAVRVDPRLGRCAVLLEPASIVAKAWEHVEHVGNRARWQPRRALVTGAGAIGLMAALFAAQRGLEVHVLDRAQGGPKPELVRALGGTYHTGAVDELGFAPDVIIECTGAAQVIAESLTATKRAGIVCLTGLSSGRHRVALDINCLNRLLVLENDVVLGSVNANRRHYELAAAALAKADRSWLERVITRRVPAARWREAYEKVPGDIKTVLEFAEA